MSEDLDLSDDELAALRLVRRKSGMAPDPSDEARLAERGLITATGNLTEAGEKAHAASANRRTKPIPRDFIGQR